MIIRRADRRDIPELTKLRLCYIATDFGEPRPEMRREFERRLPDYFERRLGSELRAYVCEEEGRLISCVLMLVTERPVSPGFPTGYIGTLLNVFTMPEYRRRGIAGSLVRMAIADGRDLGLSHIELQATDQGQSLYSEIGFVSHNPRHTPMKYQL